MSSNSSSSKLPSPKPPAEKTSGGMSRVGAGIGRVASEVHRDLAASLEKFKKQDPFIQLAISGALGYLAGLVFKKTGKLAALSVGGMYLLLRIAEHKGYINVDWDKLHQGAQETLGTDAEHAKKRALSLIERSKVFAEENVLNSTAFAFGFLYAVV